MAKQALTKRLRIPSISVQEMSERLAFVSSLIRDAASPMIRIGQGAVRDSRPKLRPG